MLINEDNYVFIDFYILSIFYTNELKLEVKMTSKKFLTIFSLLILICSCSQISQNLKGTAQLKFVILDKDSPQPIPGKLVFTKGNDDNIQLNVPETFGLAPEGNGFYTAFGKGQVELPAGTYTIYASRGMEYSIDKKKIKFKKDAVVEQTWIIKREINPAGYVSSDLHMHTTNSDGHCSEEERVTSLIGEGVEFAAATDHNFVTDLQPAVMKLGVSLYITTCPGNELSTNVGHFNIFPLPANTKPFDNKPKNANILFGYRDDFLGPVINLVNHPRYQALDYFGLLNLEPVTSEVSSPLFSYNFEAMEIMNETIGWGLLTGSANLISVWDEWFNFLNKGFRVTGIGNSDSHVLLSMPVGWPCNYIASSTENPAELDPYALAESIVQHKVSVSRGVFVNMTVNEKWPIGSDVIDTDGAVDVKVEVMAPSWVQVDKVILYGNAREIWSDEIRTKDEPLHYKKEITLQPEVDTWYIAKAEGSQSLWPIIPDQGKLAVTPVGFTNPVWVDIDGNGFEIERDRAKRFVEKYEHDIDAGKTALKKADWWLQRQILALLEKDSQLESIMIENFLTSGEKMARKFAYVRIGEKASKNNIQLLKSVKNNLTDDNERILVDTYIAKLGPKTELLDFMFNNVFTSEPVLRAEQCQILSMNQYPEEWQVIGPFENEGDTGLNVPFAPEEKVDLNESCIGKGGKQIQWHQLPAEGNGYIDLIKITEDKDHSLAYAYVSIQSSENFKTALFFGSDDGAAIWLNGKEIYRKLIRRGAYPYQECIPITLTKGENTFLVKVENNGGGWDFYFQIFDPLDNVSR